MQEMTVDLDDELIVKLDQYAANHGISRNECIARFIRGYLLQQNDDTAFGLWSDRVSNDGLDYQEQMRSEWDSRRKM